MKLRPRFESVVWVLVTTCLVMAGSVQAQTRGAGGRSDQGPDIIRVRRFSGLANKNVVRTPDYKTGVTRGIKQPQEWYQLAVTYDTAPDWIDELTFQYLAMSVIVERGKPSYSIFKTTVRYADIQAGRSHVGTAYLHPKARLRYGDLVAVAVEILHKGKVVAVASDVSGKKIPKDWWKNPNVTESQGVTVRDGYLLDRARSPFALINIDDYEFIK